MIGMCAVAGDSFSQRDAVRPSKPGIERSITMTSGVQRCA